MATAAAQGVVAPFGVVVEDAAQANRLHAKGNVGELVAGQLRLRLVEAAWLASEGKLVVQGIPSAAALLAQGPAGSRTEVGFLAYADLRSRGLLVRPWQDGWAVWPRGASPPAAPEYRFEVQSERDEVTSAQATAWADAKTVLALVDEDGAVTYYRADGAAPSGSCPVGELPHVRGVALADRVLVTDPAGAELQKREHLGVATGAGLVLSFTEAEWLRRRGVLEVPADLAARAASVQPHFRATLPVYEALRRAGVVAKSGFKFGTHLRGYRGDPDAGHAEWLVQCIAAESVPWADLSRAIRLAHGVRKEFLVAVAEPGRFVRFSWFKP